MKKDDPFNILVADLLNPPVVTTFEQALFGTPLWANDPLDAVVNDAVVAPSLERTPGDLSSLSVDKKILDLFLPLKMLNRRLKILFISESFRAYEDFKLELTQNSNDQFLPAFPQKTAELFGKMIQAMKLTPEEVMVYPVMGDSKDLSSEVGELALFFQPQMIVTLGALATQKILNVQERLTQIHGQFFQKELPQGHLMTIVPLFHPSIIENNQNMKKTAWTDMQKMMTFLHEKKLPHSF